MCAHTPLTQIQYVTIWPLCSSLYIIYIVCLRESQLILLFTVFCCVPPKIRTQDLNWYKAGFMSSIMGNTRNPWVRWTEALQKQNYIWYNDYMLHIASIHVEYTAKWHNLPDSIANPTGLVKREYLKVPMRTVAIFIQGKCNNHAIQLKFNTRAKIDNFLKQSQLIFDSFLQQQT